jgi:hypothetical protein
MIMASPQADIPSFANEPNEIRLRCPRCEGRIGHLPDSNTISAVLVCSDCCLQLRCEQGIWKSLLPERTEHFTRFMADYQFIRAAEGRGSLSSDYYLAPPYRDLSGHNSSQWTIRARTFRYIERQVLPDTFPRNKKLRVLDLGAGNGWMSYRLALQGHIPIAVD